MTPERRWTAPPVPSHQPSSVPLRCPDTPLGRARARRGWSQAKAVRALVLTADQWGWEVAAETSLKVMLHGWEHQQRRPGEMYQVLLCAVYRTTPEELGFTAGRAAPAVTVSKSQHQAATQELRERVESLEDLVRELSDRLCAVMDGGAR
ncbi:XRE family transcriptional regulator [Streptomyces albus subsp. chlorinus]|nr:XRE family transcriptional regulator [Streptomyces albus subsp. chlorinus]